LPKSGVADHVGEHYRSESSPVSAPGFSGAGQGIQP